MIPKWLRTIVSRWAGSPAAAQPLEPRFPLGQGFYFEFDEVPNGYGGYRIVHCVLRNVNDPAFHRSLVDDQGHICHFPGIIQGPWMNDLQFPADGKVRFGFWIGGFRDGVAAVSWTLQPDGRYFEDEDGFGAEDCEEITLYSCLDMDGKWVKPFSVNR